MKKLLLLLPLVVLFLTGCQPDKLDLTEFKTSASPNTGDTLYIRLGGAWGGFNNPSALLIGHEPFIYVCDKDNDRIVMLNTAGTVLGSLKVKQPVAIAQDYRDNLIVCAAFDTTISGSTVTYSAVYKINLYEANHVIANAKLTRILPVKPADFVATRKYTAVAAFFDNSYYVARFGPNNSSIYDPDNSILKFSGDTLTGKVSGLDPLSTGLKTANGINCITPFSKQTYDFITTYSSSVSFKAIWYAIDLQGDYYSKFSPGDGSDFIKPDRFKNATGSCLDAYGNIYIADAGKDSVYKFNSSGYEMQSFGGSSFFKKPVAVAHFDKILYVLDADKNEIIRFILSTDTK